MSPAWLVVAGLVAFALARLSRGGFDMAMLAPWWAIDSAFKGVAWVAVFLLAVLLLGLLAGGGGAGHLHGARVGLTH